MRTADLFALMQPGQPLFALGTVGGVRYCVMAGGAPLTSGGRVEQDVAVMEAALK
jgi:hypothetical protein